jgi:hypothetical protein
VHQQNREWQVQGKHGNDSNQLHATHAERIKQHLGGHLKELHRAQQPKSEHQHAAWHVLRACPRFLYIGPQQRKPQDVRSSERSGYPQSPAQGALNPDMVAAPLRLAERWPQRYKRSIRKLSGGSGETYSHPVRRDRPRAKRAGDDHGIDLRPDSDCELLN